MKYHTCTKCGESKPKDDEHFRFTINRAKGWRLIKQPCRECFKNNPRLYQRRRKVSEKPPARRAYEMWWARRMNEVR